jgi:hypothetical protein
MSKTSKKWFLWIGIVAVAVGGAQVARSLTEGDATAGASGKAVSADVSDSLEDLAASNHLELLQQAQKAHQARNIRSYTCTFVKQERIRGELKEPQKMRVKFTEAPFRVAMAWDDSKAYDVPAGDRIIFIEGQNLDKSGKPQMIVRPTSGFLRGLTGGSVLRLPDGKDAKKSALRPCTSFGITKSIQSLIDIYKVAAERGHLTQQHGYHDEKTGQHVKFVEFDGAKCIVLVRTLPNRPEYPAVKTITYVNLDSMLPVRVMGYDSDDKLMCDYQYRDLDFTASLTADDFTRKANDMNPK